MLNAFSSVDPVVAGVLGVEREHADAVVAVLLHAGHHMVHGGVLVAHGKLHLHLTTKRMAGFVGVKPLLELTLQGLAVEQERGPFVGPHLLVLSRAFESADGGNDAVHQDFARQPREVDHAAIAQKLTQVSSHRARRRCIRRPQIHNEDAGLHR